MNKKNIKIAIGVLCAVVVLGVAFWFGGNAPGLQGFDASQKSTQPHTDALIASPVAPPEPTPEATPEATPEVTPQPKPAPAPVASPDSGKEHLAANEKLAAAKDLGVSSSAGVATGDTDYSKEQGMELDKETGKDQYLTDPVPEGKPVPTEPQNAAISDTAYTCTLSVSCAAILDNMSWLDPEKAELVPQDGIIFPSQTVTFYEGESVFNVLLRTMKQNKIHMEYSDTPIYNSAYIEGICNLYEFDCGELSGWMYSVNDWFPNYGCSRYQLKQDDVISWVYTCDLGVDVGGFAAVED